MQPIQILLHLQFHSNFLLFDIQDIRRTAFMKPLNWRYVIYDNSTT